MDFLIDSGADVSLISLGQDTVRTENFCTSVQGIGGRQLIGPKNQYSVRFSCDKAKVYKVWLRETTLSNNKVMVILGRDFLSQFKKTEFDWENSCVRLGENWIFMASSDWSKLNICDSLQAEEKKYLAELLKRYPELFATNPRAPRCSNGATHEIKSIDDQPVKSKVRRIPKKWAEEVNAQISEMIEHDIIEPSCSPYNSNPLLVTKDSDQSKRFVVDFRLLNRTTVPDTYPLPSVDELVDQTLSCKFFTQLDLASGYWTVPISKDHCHKTAFSVPRGKYQFKRMPFGLKNAQATFQRYMDSLVEEMKQLGAKGVDAYVDNIIISSKSFDEHLWSLQIVLSVLDKHHMSLRKDKCEFAFGKMEFLGFSIDGETVKPGSKNVDKIKDFPTPTSRKELQRFLGIANYNRRFIEGYSLLTAPLNSLTSTKVPFIWTKSEQVAFDKLKLAFHEALQLYIPDWSKLFVIRTDASRIAVGSVLGQYDDEGAFRPVGYHSETLNKNTKNWSATERELYAIISASRKWKPYCYEKIVFYSDHEPLRSIHKQKDPRGKIGRWILELENLDYSIKYFKGVDNQEADHLSRILGQDPPSPDPSVFALEENLLRKAQSENTEISNATKVLNEEKTVESGPFKNFANLSVQDNLLCKGSRIIVPHSITEQVIQEYHGQSHPGVENSILLLAGRFYWKGMRKQIESFVLKCRTCAQCKHRAKPKAAVQNHKEVEELFEMISMDIASMPISKKGNCYFLLVIDIFSKLMTAIALPNAQAETIVDALWYRWFGYFGLPRFLQSDQGNNVDGKKIREMCKDLAIKKLRSSAYHPAGNGSAERAIGYLKTILRSMCLSRGIPISDWDKLLPEAILMFNDTQNSSSKFSPFETAYGTSPNLALDNKLGVDTGKERLDPTLLRENIILNREEARSNYQRQANKSVKENAYEIGDWVLLKRNHGENPKMNPKWDQLFEVVKKVGPVCWGIVNFSDGKSKIVHHDQLLPAGIKQDARWTIGGGRDNTETDISHPVVGKIHIPNVEHPAPQAQTQHLPQLDKCQFTRNVFNSPVAQLNNTSVTTTTGSGRVVKPVIGNRLVDQI